MPRIWSRVFWQSAAETAIGYAAAGAGSVLALHGADLLTSIPWYTVLSGAGIGALLGVCKSLSSLKVQPGNGTDSYNARVVAAPGVPKSNG
jgi:hypothetical protein